MASAGPFLRWVYESPARRLFAALRTAQPKVCEATQFSLDPVRKHSYFILQEPERIMPQSIEKKAYNKINREGRGWAFSPSDLAPLGSREAIDIALYRLTRKGLIRRVIRGVYVYPRRSELLDQELAPDIDQVAHALARKFGWRIQPSGPVATSLACPLKSLRRFFTCPMAQPGRTRWARQC